MFYRKHITIPESDAGKKLFLEFEAVNSVYLYVNGEIVGYYEAVSRQQALILQTMLNRVKTTL